MFYHSITFVGVAIFCQMRDTNSLTHSHTPSVLNSKLHPSHWMGVERNSKMDGDQTSLSSAINDIVHIFLYLKKKKKKAFYLLIKEYLSL
jgi:hypothetical protein